MCLCNMPLPMAYQIGDPGSHPFRSNSLKQGDGPQICGKVWFRCCCCFYPTPGISPLFIKCLLNKLNIASIGTKEINSILTWTFFIAEPTMSLSPLFLLHRCFSFERGKMRMLLSTNDQRLMKKMHLVYIFPVVL